MNGPSLTPRTRSLSVAFIVSASPKAFPPLFSILFAEPKNEQQLKKNEGNAVCLCLCLCVIPRLRSVIAVFAFSASPIALPPSSSISLTVAKDDMNWNSACTLMHNSEVEDCDWTVWLQQLCNSFSSFTVHTSCCESGKSELRKEKRSMNGAIALFLHNATPKVEVSERRVWFQALCDELGSFSSNWIVCYFKGRGGGAWKMKELFVVVADIAKRHPKNKFSESSVCLQWFSNFFGSVVPNLVPLRFGKEETWCKEKVETSRNAIWM